MARKISKLSRDIQEYTPKDWLDDKGNPEEGAFVVSFKPLSKRQLATYQDSSSRIAMGTNAIMLGNSTGNLSIFKEAITGWKNLVIDDAEVKFEKDGLGNVKDELLEDIPLDIIEEIANYILKVSRFGTDEAGN